MRERRRDIYKLYLGSVFINRKLREEKKGGGSKSYNKKV